MWKKKKDLTHLEKSVWLARQILEVSDLGRFTVVFSIFFPKLICFSPYKKLRGICFRFHLICGNI